jgi:hypothetical protein
MSAKTTSRLSVIIPALNEVHTLPNLLDALSAQTRPPDEIIVADAGSTDGTAEMARARGASVVRGGRPGPGRNAGARAAAGDVFLFLDADVLPPPHFIAALLKGFERSGAEVATSLIDPIGDNPTHKLIAEVVNLYLQFVQPFSPHAPGFCLLARRELHEAIGGFDETVLLAEDFDYVQRAARVAGFDVLTNVRIPVSLRRLEEEGLTRLAFKHLWGELHALAGKPIYSAPFEYQFGAHPPPGSAPPSRPVIDVAQLRKQLGRFEDPLQRLSAAGSEQLDRLLHRDWMDSARERFRLVLEPPDWLILHRYLQLRLAVMRRTRRAWRAAFSKLQTGPLKAGLSRLDLKGLRARSGSNAAKDDDEKSGN